jgi:hypothetical protein
MKVKEMGPFSTIGEAGGSVSVLFFPTLTHYF